MFWLKEKNSWVTPKSHWPWVRENWVPLASSSPAGFQKTAVESSETPVKLLPMAEARAPMPIFWKLVLVLPAPETCWAAAGRLPKRNRVEAKSKRTAGSTRRVVDGLEFDITFLVKGLYS